jgi:hypothetical protein
VRTGKQSVLEAVRLRLTDAENGYAKSKPEAEAEALHMMQHIPSAKSPDNVEEGQITRRFMGRMQATEVEIVVGRMKAMEGEMASLWDQIRKALK